MRGLYSVPARRGRRIPHRPGIRRAFRAALDRRRARHAGFLAGHGCCGHRGRSRRRRRRRRHRPRRHRDGLFRGRRPGSRRRHLRHRLPQPEGLHGHEDRATRRASRRRRLRPRRDPRTRAGGLRRRRRSAATCASEDVWDGFVEKVLSFVDPGAIRPLRVVVDAANGMAGAMLPPVLERLPQLDVVRCNFEPDGTFPNHEPNPLLPENREFIVREDPRGERRPRRRVRRRRRPLLLRRRHGRVRPRRLRHRAPCRARSSRSSPARR